MSKSQTMTVAHCLAVSMVAILPAVFLAGCGKKGTASEKKTAEKSENDFLDKNAKQRKSNSK